MLMKVSASASAVGDPPSAVPLDGAMRHSPKGRDRSLRVARTENLVNAVSVALASESKMRVEIPEAVFSYSYSYSFQYRKI